jgi:hypothetical protein
MEDVVQALDLDRFEIHLLHELEVIDFLNIVDRNLFTVLDDDLMGREVQIEGANADMCEEAGSRI